MDASAQPVAGPSRATTSTATQVQSKPNRKPRSAHPDQPRHPKRSLPPPLPAPPAHPSRPGGTTTTHPHLPIKVLQGAATRRTDSTKRGFGKEVIFVTRRTGLGALMGRCRSLVVDEGYTHLVLHSLGAAIPHSLLLLHAVLDTLPYPRGPRGLWYEIETGTAECVDHIEPEDPSRPMAKLPKRSRRGKEKTHGKDDEIAEKQPATAASLPSAGGKDIARDVDAAVVDKAEAVPLWLAGIGSVEAAAPIRQVRLTSSMKIDIYIGPKPSLVPTTPSKQPKQSKAGEGRSRPNKKRRVAQLAQRTEAEKAAAETVGDGAEAMDEEDMCNAAAADDDEEEEAIEEVEVR